MITSTTNGTKDATLYGQQAQVTSTLTCLCHGALEMSQTEKTKSTAV